MTSKQKGELLENLVAELHEEHGVKVETRVKLPVINSNPPILRELDVLLTAVAAGYPIRLAFSCKNESKKVQITDVDSFAQALQQVGIPTQHGFIACLSGATKDAKCSARLNGIRIFKYKGLDDKRLAEKIETAIQSQIYFLLVGRSFNSFDYLEDPSSEIQEAVNLRMERPTGDVGLAILECLHRSWDANEIPLKIGDLTIVIRPENVAERWLIIAQVNIVGLLGKLSGSVKHRALVDCDDDTVQKLSLSAEFNQPSQNLNLLKIESEAILNEIANETSLHLVTRIRVPRISWNGLYWPMTKSEYDQMLEAKSNGRPIGLERDYLANLINAWPKL